MKPLTTFAHDLVRDVIRPGDIVIDATVGNGHDTLFLSECVGPSGKVFGFDIQQSALDSANALLADYPNAILFHDSHANMVNRVPIEHHQQVQACMFNLGYLPGGDKSVTTCEETTVAGLQAALELLKPGGLCTILAYVGHAGGLEEFTAIERYLCEHSDIDFRQRPADSPTSPRLLWFTKKS